MTGNIFKNNTKNYPGGSGLSNIEGMISRIISGGYNVSDGSSGSSYNWTFADTDITMGSVAFSDSFKPYSTESSNLRIVTTLPADFPAVYFDGSSRSLPAVPGAMPHN
ncbi:hypothetical protein AGMMS4952_27760 [Spirochaetia bacterium]|nr:hypothetical protein AGMMS4952_27760 [Spirochaetia bacterium]